jgi:hypothetical protein
MEQEEQSSSLTFDDREKRDFAGLGYVVEAASNSDSNSDSNNEDAANDTSECDEHGTIEDLLDAVEETVASSDASTLGCKTLADLRYLIERRCALPFRQFQSK